uniref:ABC transmembrane type-1 domain-containing protein n=1 Tax=Heterorhabditis bacteriophora TaxID=37862 RepID=A0A1I7WPX1_HETBA
MLLSFLVFILFFYAIYWVIITEWVPTLPNGLTSKVVMEVLWEEELQANPQSPSLFKAIFRFTKTRLWAACAVFNFCVASKYEHRSNPLNFVVGLVAFAERVPATGEDVDYQFGLLLVVSICFVEIARVLSYGATWAISYRTGIRVRGALLGFLFKRLIGVRSLGKKNSAEIVNIFANDGQRLFDAVTFAPLVLVGPLVLIGGIVYLLAVIGPWSLLGIFVFFIFDAIQRISLMGEIIRCIRVIKMNCWEENFSKEIEQMRHDEKVDIRTAGYAQSLAIACGPVVPVVAAILTFLGVILSGNDLLASDAFASITVFFVMLFGIRMIPYGSRYLAEAIVAIKRIQELLLASESSTSSAFSELTPVNTEQSSFLLDNVTLIIKRKELTGVCGVVGSGKSALLNSVIGHVRTLYLFSSYTVYYCYLIHLQMYHVDGELEVGGSVAYVPQTPWIQNTTLQENILFGLPMNTQRYYKVCFVS